MPRGDRGGASLGSGIRCVAARCGNTNANAVSLHSFPTDPVLLKKWIDFVKVKRGEWLGPTKYSALCSTHFTSESFPFRFRFQLEQMGTTPKRVVLNKDAVPTIHAVTVDVPLASLALPESNCTSCAPAPPTTTMKRLPRLEMLSPSEQASSQSSPPKKIRRAYQKREVTRIIKEHEKLSSSNAEEMMTLPIVSEAVAVAQYSEYSETHTSSVGCQVTLRPRKRSKQCQTSTKSTSHSDTRPKMISRGCQTDNVCIMKDAFAQVRESHFEDVTQPDEGMQSDYVDHCSIQDPVSSPLHDDPKDPTYQPPSPMSDYSDYCIDQDENDHGTPVSSIPKMFLVSEHELLDLFDACSKCCSPTRGTILYTNGSLVKIQQECGMCSYTRHWYSQPFVGNKPAGNLLISAAILFSGSIPTKSLRMQNFMNMATISISTYMKHQTSFLYPAIQAVWGEHQASYIQHARAHGRPVVLGGDGRADTPGHCAKYGTYSMLDLERGEVVDLQLVQSNETVYSQNMEKEGLVRCVKFFKDNGIPIGTIITDRHVQITKWIRENMTETTHYFDVWHVAKGLKKKLFALSKEKDCSMIQPWTKSIVNHLYWTASSTVEKNSELQLAKWNSLANHVINVHTGHGTLFNACDHEKLEGRERKKKWLKPETKVFEKLELIINSRQMKKDIPMLSHGHQTSALEGFHSVINHFAPKMIGFSYHGMINRVRIAALHFKENNGRMQASTVDGHKRFRIVFPKHKKGQHTVRKVLVDCTYDYVDSLLQRTMQIALTARMRDPPLLNALAPTPLHSNFERPNKEEAITQLVSRFCRHPPP